MSDSLLEEVESLADERAIRASSAASLEKAIDG